MNLKQHVRDIFAGRDWRWIALALMAGLAIRLYGIFVIHAGTLDSDESWHIYIADQGGFGDVVRYNFADNVHPPLYYLLLHGWMRLSEGLPWLRLLSLIPWVPWVILSYHIGHRIGGRSHALGWLALACFSSISIHASISIREYMWMMLFAGAQFYLWLQLIRDPLQRGLAMYFICGLLAVSPQTPASPRFAPIGGWPAC